jgi:hypothetical protein
MVAALSLQTPEATSLSRLWQQGMHPEASELFAPIYGWCTEGFDTADLQEPGRCWRNSGDNTNVHTSR